MALSEKDKWGIVLIAVVVAALVAIFAARLKTNGAPHADAEGCIHPITGNTVIVLDHSESVAEQTLKEMEARVMAHIEGLPADESVRVTVFYVSELSKKKLIPQFSRCKPKTEGNRLVESKKAVEKGYVKNFLEPLEATLKVMPPEDKESPIAQAIIDVSLSEYLRGSTNSLLVFSDMLENTPKFSLYKCGDAATVVPNFRESRKGGQERPKFINTAVQLNIIPRLETSKATLKCRDKLWPWFFGDNDGGNAKVEVSYLPGA